MGLLWLQGPTFETLAEYKMVKFLVQIALGCLLSQRLLWPSHGCRDFGVSIITDMGNEESIDTISHDEVLEAAQRQNQKLEI
jgi:purine-nucleoside phosphorylase